MFFQEKIVFPNISSTSMFCFIQCNFSLLKMSEVQIWTLCARPGDSSSWSNTQNHSSSRGCPLFTHQLWSKARRRCSWEQTHFLWRKQVCSAGLTRHVKQHNTSSSASWFIWAKVDLCSFGRKFNTIFQTVPENLQKTSLLYFFIVRHIL